ncbi:unnamed protein product [Rotaria sordida]|uniref:SAP domain-containing protein n=1 Tax=Rotaria sordida TaxID=392033 RepID=A0A815KPP7_9BILA|nr:unnamed protein product [Rotaria sordida]
MSSKRDRDKEDLPYESDDDDDADSDYETHMPASKKSKKGAPKPLSLRVQLNALTVPVLKNILRSNHQNPFGNKAELISRIIYLVRHGGYPRCPKYSIGTSSIIINGLLLSLFDNNFSIFASVI